MADDFDRIVARCRSGDREARRALFERFHPTAYRLAVRMVGRQDAGDVTQEIFLRVFAGLAGFQGTADFSTWLYRVAVNECLRHLRGRSRRPLALTDEPASPAAAPDHVLEQADLLERALDELDVPLRTVFLLREAEGLTYGQIGAVMGVPEGTVASQLNRARGRLQAFVRRVEQDR